MKALSGTFGYGAGAAQTSGQATLDAVLTGTPPTDLARFQARYARCRRDALGALATLYGESAADIVFERLASVAAKAFADRSSELAILDAAREVTPDWFQAPDRIGYVAYCEKFGPTLADIEQRVPHLTSLGVTYFHLMKVIRPRPEPNDGGFAVLDYRDVDPTLGSVDDLRSLATRLRRAGISLCLDVVMNHTAREHEWAVAARAGDEAKRAYYLTYPDRMQPDEWELSLPEVFPEIAPGNFTWDEALQRWVWSTFNDYQWDLNFANPAVLVEMLDVMLSLANNGVEVLRLDAVAFTWKRKGTNCQNQPEAHLIAQILRMFTNLAAPGVLIKAEAIVGPRDLSAYLGEHGREGQRAECQLAYHNQLMVMIWSALATRDAVLLTAGMRRLGPTPRDAAWATYVRCHDDIGWAIDDADAASVGVHAAGHRKFLAEFYRGDFAGSFAEGASFSVNEETGDERTCGSTASLAGLGRALAAHDAAAVERAIQRIVLGYGLAASFGMPLLYMGDEVGLLNDPSYLVDATRADDSRWTHRPAMDWDAVARTEVAGSVERRVYSSLQHVFRVRKSTAALAQGGDAWVIDTDDSRVFAFGRYHRREGRLLGLANFSDAAVTVSADVFSAAGLGVDAREVLGTAGVAIKDGRVHLPTLALAWFTDDLAERVVPSR
jgi:amylosucrase